MKAYEVNFDGLVGPTHNYSGLSFGNIASEQSLKDVSNPKLAAQQGLAKMKALSDKGLKYLADNLHDLTGNLQLGASRKNDLNANSLNHLRQGAFKNINKLSLYGFNLSGKGSLDFISDLSGLSAIFIYGKLNDANIENIAKRCTDLKILQLDLKGNQIGLTDLALTHLKSMKSLEKLEFFDANPFSNTAIEEFRKTLPDCEVIAR